MKKAIQNPTEDTIFELSSVVEANAFKAGVRSCLQMMHCLFIEEQEKHMLEKLYELWSIEKRVSVTIKSVGLNCTFTTVIENIYKGEYSVVLEFGDNNMKLDVTENCMCNEYEMTVVYNETTITINWEEDYI